MKLEEYIHILKISQHEQIFEDPNDEIEYIQQNYRENIEPEEEYFKKLEATL